MFACDSCFLMTSTLELSLLKTSSFVLHKLPFGIFIIEITSTFEQMRKFLTWICFSKLKAGTLMFHIISNAWLSFILICAACNTILFFIEFCEMCCKKGKVRAGELHIFSLAHRSSPNNISSPWLQNSIITHDNKWQWKSFALPRAAGGNFKSYSPVELLSLQNVSSFMWL